MTGSATTVPAALTLASATTASSTTTAASADLRPLLEQVGLSHAAAVLPAWLDRAAREELPYADLLQGLLEEEATARTQATTQRRLREAVFPFAAGCPLGD